MARIISRNVGSISAGTIIGIAAGWASKSYVKRRNQRDENRSLVETIKRFERRLYEAGHIRAKKIDQLKTDINKKISL
ncbi:hypothetical protein [Virgibacillus salexigens]|uniref:Uncharacterized protein n=1 Tax=Virgibacillus massiliensis TaxID=1462526 RepID=A0A024QFS3_9BACI|nr:hypothetical protein [Virgibacillus massiliensis]CDQ41354.1 hypothetical protein BN990_03723 [Virgibacillus massiliensis]